MVYNSHNGVSRYVFFLLLCLFCFGVAFADSKVMVRKLEVFSKPDVTSKVIGHYSKGDYPVLNFDDAEDMFGVDFNGKRVMSLHGVFWRNPMSRQAPSSTRPRLRR